VNPTKIEKHGIDDWKGMNSSSYHHPMVHSRTHILEEFLANAMVYHQP
jgi:hypothetical protein